MGAFTVFLGTITGIMITDVYWFVYRTHVSVPAMYQPHGRCKYTFCCFSVPPTIPGVRNACNFRIWSIPSKPKTLGKDRCQESPANIYPPGESGSGSEYQLECRRSHPSLAVREL
ncbi:hypothetical protein V8E52_000016 [Russula decolorans]